MNLEVLAPQLNVAVDGPKRRYLERQAAYQLSGRKPRHRAGQAGRTDRKPTAGLEVRQRQQRRLL